MKKTTKRRQNGGGAGASAALSPKDLLCKQIIDKIMNDDPIDKENNKLIIEMLDRKESVEGSSEGLSQTNIIKKYDCTNPVNGVSLLIIASGKGNNTIVEYLLGKGADINFTNDKGNTALHLAALNGHIGVVITLLNNTDVDKAKFNKTGYTPLEFAISSNADLETKIEIINEFRRNAINMNARTKFGYGLLHVAAANNKHEIIPFLIENGADINSKTDDKFENTPLILACLSGYEEVAEVLLKNGANPNLENKTNSTIIETPMTPLVISITKGFTEIVKILIKNRADPNKVSYEGFTPLQYAAIEGNAQIVDFLLKNGAKYRIDDFSEKATPAVIAFFNGHVKLANKLWEYAETDEASKEAEKKAAKANAKEDIYLGNRSINNPMTRPNNYDDDDVFTGVVPNFEKAADEKPGGSKRAYPPRKTRRQSKRRRRHNKK